MIYDMTRFCIIFILFVFCLTNVELWSAEFRLDNEILPGEVKSTTYLLENGDFYSMIGQHGEITYYDFQAQSFAILSPALRIQTRIGLEETKKEIASLREQLQSHPKFAPGTLNAFVLKPAFQSEFDAQSGDLALRSPWFDYEVATTNFPHTEMARAYFEFCDLSCYLNFRLSKSKTMLVRLEVNRILATHHRFPTQISATIYPNGQGPLAKAEKAESRHRIVLRFDEEDRRRLDQARESMRTFTSLPFSGYEQRIAEQK